MMPCRHMAAVGVNGLMVKNLITTWSWHIIHLKSLLNFLPLTYHHSHFLAATLDFTSFFTIAFLGAVLFFTAWLFWIRHSVSQHCRILSLNIKGLREI